LAEESNPRKEAAAKLEESFASGPSTFNEPVAHGGTNPVEPTGVFRSYWDTLGASAEQTFRTLPTAQLLDLDRRIQIEEEGKAQGRSKLSPEEANQLYPHMSRPFSEPVDPVVAGELAKREMKIQELQSVVDGGNRGTIGGISRFGLGLAMGLFDPINVATGLGVGKAVGVGGRLLGLEKSLVFDTAATGGRALTRDAAQGAIGNVLSAPVYAGLSSGVQQEYDPVSEIAYQSILGAGLHVGIHALKAGFHYASPRLRALMEGAQKADAIAGQSAVAAVNSDKVVTSGSVVQDVVNERRMIPGEAPAQVHGNAVPREFSPITSPQDYNNRSFFVPAQLQNETLHSTRGAIIDRDYGPGVYTTDNPVVANGYAASKYGHDAGGVFEVRATKGEMKIVDLSQDLPKEVSGAIESVLSEIVGTTEGLPEIHGKPGQAVYDTISDLINESHLPEDTFSQIDSALSDHGYDGIRFDGGMGGVKHNVVKLFDVEKTGDAGGRLSEVSRFSADRAAIPEHTPQDLQAAIDHHNSIESDALYDKEAHEKLDSVAKAPPEDLAQPELESALNDLHQEIAAAKQEGRLSPDLEKELAKIDEESRSSADQDSIVKAALHCLSRSN
jgi:hypothetical protein